MTHDLIVRPAAEAEVESAVVWYERRLGGLGGRFLAALDDLLARVVANPLHFPEVERKVRRALFRRFPYTVYFTVEGDRVVVLAVLHQHRNPAIWKVRAPQAKEKPE